MTNAFDIAWSVLKALPEYQSYEEHYDPTNAGYDQPTRVLQRRRGTLPPAIARMMREQQEGSRYRQLSRGSLPLDTRIRPTDAPQGRLQEYPVHSMEGFSDLAPMSGYEESDEYRGRHGQLKRGSVFDPTDRATRYFPVATTDPETGEIDYERSYFGPTMQHPPKQPLDPNEAAAYLQSIGF